MQKIKFNLENLQTNLLWWVSSRCSRSSSRCYRHDWSGAALKVNRCVAGHWHSTVCCCWKMINKFYKYSSQQMSLFSRPDSRVIGRHISDLVYIYTKVILKLIRNNQRLVIIFVNICEKCLKNIVLYKVFFLILHNWFSPNRWHSFKVVHFLSWKIVETRILKVKYMTSMQII